MVFCFPNTNAKNATHTIIDWCAVKDVPGGLISDGPNHFKNESVRLVSKGLKTPYHFNLQYCPLSNFAEERLDEQIHVLQSVISEVQMDNKEWLDLIPIVQSVLNNAPSPHLGNFCSFTAFMGRNAKLPILTFFRSAMTTPITVTEGQRESKLTIKKLVKLCADLHARVKSTMAKHRKQPRETASKVLLPNFTRSNFVPVGRFDFHACEKLRLRWRGPRRVREALND